MKYSVEQFNFYDAFAIDYREFDLKRMAAAHDWAGMLYRATSAGLSITFFVDDKPAAIAWGYQIWPGVVEMGMLTGKLVEKYPIAGMKGTREFIREIKSTYKPHRIQCICHVDNEKSIRWLQALGFKEEGVMEQYTTDGSDHYRYAMIIEKEEHNA